MRPLLAILFMITLSFSSIGHTEVVPASGSRGSVFFGEYEPKQLESLSQLPAPIKERIQQHLSKRLGEANVERLKLSGGQIVDIAKLHQVEPDSKEYEWEIPAYVLEFEFSLPDVGLPFYTAQMEIRADGSIIEEIDLPAFASDPSKEKLLPFLAVLALAIENGFSEDKLDAMLVYDEERDLMAWRFSETVSDDGSVIKGRVLLISAHSGDVLETSQTEAIR